MVTATGGIAIGGITGKVTLDSNIIKTWNNDDEFGRYDVLHCF